MHQYRKLISQLTEGFEPVRGTIEPNRDIVRNERCAVSGVTDVSTDRELVTRYISREDVMQVLRQMRKPDISAIVKADDSKFYDLVVSSDNGERALLKSGTADSTYRIVDAHGAILHEFQLPDHWSGGGFSPNGKVVWFSYLEREDAIGKRYVILNISNPDKPEMIDYNLPEPCDDPVFVPDETGTVFQSILMNGKIWVCPFESDMGSLINLKQGFFAPVFSPKGDWMVMKDLVNGPMILIVDSHGNVRGDFYIFEPCGTPAISPDSEWIVVVNGQDVGNIYIFDPYARPIAAIPVPEAGYQPQFSPDGDWAVILSRNNNGHFWIIGRDGNPIGSWEQLGALTPEELRELGIGA